jgi:hypothetical protein
MNTALAIYLAGVVIGLWRTDARWPIGPVAFVVTVAVLLAATPVAFIGPRSK